MHTINQPVTSYNLMLYTVCIYYDNVMLVTFTVIIIHCVAELFTILSCTVYVIIIVVYLYYYHM